MKIHYSWIIFFIFEDVIGDQERFAGIGSIHLIDKNISNAINSKEVLNTRSQQRHGGRHKDDNKKSNVERTYTAWSHWTGCGQTYKTESRKRTCLKKTVCYDAVQTETRSCQNKRLSKVREGRGSTGRALPQYRFGRENTSENENDYIGFQVITEKQNSQDEMSKRRDNDYTKWTRWSKCSERCITYRRRYCKRHSRCGRKMAREAAYCYMEGSFCQQWIATKLKRKLKNDVDNTVSPKAVDEPKCGIQYSGRSSQNKYKYWNMVKIIGGRPSPKGKWPWQIVILDKYKEAFCGGTLIHLRWVLTAAHCVRKRLFVRVGEHNLRLRDPNELEMRITEAIIHPLYDPNIVDNDIAMLRLPHPARPDLGHTTACLPTFRQHLPSGRLCTILGWGKLKSTDHYGTNILHEVQIPIVPMSTCKKTYHDYYITPNMFCAGFRKGKMDSCAGDSGGPLLCKDPNVAGEPWTVFGITSFGDGCGKKGKYGIYTRAPNYIKWVHRVLKMSYYQDN